MDAEMYDLLVEEATERLLVVSARAKHAIEALAGSLLHTAEALERLANVYSAGEERRSEFRRLECPGQFDL